MKTYKVIIWNIIISIIFTSCFSKNYRIITKVDRKNSYWREIHTIADSISDALPFDLSSGWDISQTDTVEKEYLSLKNKKNIKISKKFNSIDELSTGMRSDIIFPTPKESLKKQFRWFYTYYAFTAIYPEVTDKGHVPIEKFLNKAEQKFYFQGDMSAHRGMNGVELKEQLDGIETNFLEWYTHSMYEECFDVILHYAKDDFQSTLPAVKDTLYSINEKQIKEQPNLNDVCAMLDRHLSTDYFSDLFTKNGQEMENRLEKRLKTTNELLNYNIQYDLILPGKIIATNTELQNDGAMTWNINLYRFLADDYYITAESRATNIWAFAVTLLLVLFSVYSFIKK